MVDQDRSERLYQPGPNCAKVELAFWPNMTILLATRNAYKIREIRTILGEMLIYFSLEDFPKTPEVTEDASTFEGNATKKAVALAEWVANAVSGEAARARTLYVIADDSGLEVDALKGAP